MTNSKAQPETRLLNVKQLAELLGVSVTSVYRLTERRSIPFFRLPRGLRFAESDVSRFLQGRRVESVSDNYERQKD